MQTFHVIGITVVLLMSILIPLSTIGEAADPQVTVDITSNQPPEGVAVTHDIVLEMSSLPSEGQTSIQLPNTYAGTNLSVATVSARNESQFLHLVATEVDGPDNDGYHDTIRIEYRQSTDQPEPVTITVSTLLRHPVVTTDTQYELRVHSENETTTDSFSVRDINQSRAGLSGGFNTRRGTGYVYPNATIFQGEDDIQFGAPLILPLHRQTGGGIISDGVVSPSQATGRYSNDGSGETPSVLVKQPRITQFRVENERGVDVKGGTVPSTENPTLTVTAEYNFHRAEGIQLEITNDQGFVVTRDLLVGAPVKTGADTAQWEVQLPADPAPQYQLQVTGTDDLTESNAKRTATVEVTNSRISLNWNEQTRYQGTSSQLQVSNGQPGASYLITIPREEFKREATARDIVQSISDTGDTTTIGVITANGSLYSQSEYETVDQAAIDQVYLEVTVGEDAIGQALVNTEHMQPGELRANVYARGITRSDLAQRSLPHIDAATLQIEVPNIRLDNPQTATIGEEITIQGTRDPGIQHLAVYARRPGTTEPFKRIDLDTNPNTTRYLINLTRSGGSFNQAEQTLSRGAGSGNAILQQPGTYILGVIGWIEGTSPNEVPQTISKAEFGDQISDTQPITIHSPTLNLTVETVNGEVATIDRNINISGTASTANSVVLVVLDDRQGAVIRTINVDKEGRFDIPNLAIPTLHRGHIRVYAFTPGRDGVFGDGYLPTTDSPATTSVFSRFTRGLATRNQTTTQIRSHLFSETVDDAASDDNLEAVSFQLTEPRITVQQVSELGTQNATGPIRPGSTVIIHGTTNLQPEEHNLEILIRSPNGQSRIIRKESWSGNTWQVQFRTDTYGMGQFTVTATTNEGGVDARTTFVVQEPQPSPTSTPTPTRTYVLSITTIRPTATPTSTEFQTTRKTGAGWGLRVMIGTFILVTVWLVIQSRYER